MERAPMPIEKEEDTMTIKSISRYFFIGMLMILGSVFYSARSMAQDLLRGTELSEQYLVDLSGTVMSETFSGAQALLTLKQSSGSRKHNNPYTLIIEGFPNKNSRNSFFWDSEYSEMTAIANEITCDIKRTFVKQIPMHFFYLSPELQKNDSDAPEDEKFALKAAIPTSISVRAGKLKLRIHSNSVSGTVWMKGYDPVEKAFVLYNARLSGKKTYHLQPKQATIKGTTEGKE
jgi:hypothetical protein